MSCELTFWPTSFFRRLLSSSCLSTLLSACSSTTAPGRILWRLMFGTFSQICGESPNLVKVWQEFLALHMETEVLLYCWQRYIMRLDSSPEGTHSWVSMAAVSDFILLTATCKSRTMRRERIVAFTWQRLCELTTILRYTSIAVYVFMCIAGLCF